MVLAMVLAMFCKRGAMVLAMVLAMVCKRGAMEVAMVLAMFCKRGAMVLAMVFAMFLKVVWKVPEKAGLLETPWTFLPLFDRTCAPTAGLKN